ncbi:hypothetical protein ACH5RR_030031 [Cinchona calisaya]|uniref:Uncharacterized protein n=1 Tax=Cinchona calisaya TaxID=153742 RepID=A0ABD2YWY8_9GENT
MEAKLCYFKDDLISHFEERISNLVGNGINNQDEENDDEVNHDGKKSESGRVGGGLIDSGTDDRQQSLGLYYRIGNEGRGKAVKVLAKSPTFAREPRHLQFEADINRLLLYTSYKLLGKDANDADAEEIIDMASKASLTDQQKQAQENIHSQIETFCTTMDGILLPNLQTTDKPYEPVEEKNSTSHRSGLSLAVGRGSPLNNHLAKTVASETKPLSQSEVSQRLKDLIGYTLGVKPSEIPHKDAGNGLFLNGEPDVGAVIAFYPGVVYSPAYYQYITGYPRVDAQNSYLITRYDGTIINAQPWGAGGESDVLWNGSGISDSGSNVEGVQQGSDRMWKLLSKPLDGSSLMIKGDILKRRNPLAFAHYANHPAKDMVPNVMVCPYDFPLTEKNMRAYIPNILFGNGEEVSMKRIGSFWFKSWKSGSRVSDVPILRTLVLVATIVLCDEELLLNYRLSNSKRWPSWYTPVDDEEDEEDRRRWT